MIFTRAQRSIVLSSENEQTTLDPVMTEQLKNEALTLLGRLGALCQLFFDYFIKQVEIPSEEIDELARNLHNLKGLVHMTNFLSTTEMLHVVEGYMELIRSKIIPLDKEIVEFLQDIHNILETIYKKFPSSPEAQMLAEIEQIIQKIKEKKEENIEEDFDTKNLSGQNVSQGPDLDPEILQDFLSNANELLEKLSRSMLELESDPKNTQAIENIFRNVHTIKGTSGMFGFKAIEKVTHRMENLFDQIKKNKLTVTRPLMDALFFAIDRVKGMFESIKQKKSPELAINDVLEKLRLALKAKASTPVVVPVQKAEEKKQIVREAEGGTIRVDLKRLDSLVNLVGELVVDRTRFARIEDQLRGNSELSHQMSESVLLFGRHMNEVQNIIMKIRMIPIGNAFYKFTRVVRDLSRQLNKEIDLHISGGSTELDKTLVEEIADPLVHLIRNSVDHGVELAEEREKAGKPRTGNIYLKANQDGNMIVITVRDDGKGLQVDKIRNKAIERGLIKASDQLTSKEIFNLIFESGFSTAEKITNISGRGVGMDVVKKRIIKLKGIIEIDSELGQGTIISIKLPLTLAIIPSLMVEACGESYAIPLVNVIESMRIKQEDIQKVGMADFVKLRERILPILKLSDVFDLTKINEEMWYKEEDVHTDRLLKGKNDLSFSQDETMVDSLKKLKFDFKKKSLQERNKQPRIIFVVVAVGEKRVGLIVDRLLGQQEIVIKPIGSMLGDLHGLAGGCVLGNGRVALVLDVGEIVGNFSQNRIGVNTYVHAD